MLADDVDYYPAIEEKALKENTITLVNVDGVKIIFIKHNGEIYAVDNGCPHQACAFSGGKLDGDFLICPCHDWRFNLETGEHDVKPYYRLKFYEHKTVDGKIYVKLDD